MSQIALTSKSGLTRVMSPHFSTVTVTIHFATSELHSTHMMQEDVRVLFNLSQDYGEGVCMHVHAYVHVCTCVNMCTVGVCGW